jgi:low affinity Fe/Cu permease
MKKINNKNNSKDYFAIFAKIISEGVGKAWVFLIAFMFVILWLISGPFFNFSDTWQLILNTVSSAVTFLMVFVIQHTQNREISILNLKLDEIIKSTKEANNASIDLERLSTKDLKKLEKEYERINQKRTKE